MTTLEFKTQVTRVDQLVFGFAMRLTKDKENAKDLMQETMMRAYINCHLFTEGTNFKAWITTIMRNCFINDYRKQNTRNKWEQQLQDNKAAKDKYSVDNMGPSIIMLKELGSLMDNLSPKNRVPFDMFFNGYQYQEIAEQLDIPIGTVKSRIFFSRKKLTKLIHQNYGEYAVSA